LIRILKILFAVAGRLVLLFDLLTALFSSTVVVIAVDAAAAAAGGCNSLTFLYSNSTVLRGPARSARVTRRRRAIGGGRPGRRCSIGGGRKAVGIGGAVVDRLLRLAVGGEAGLAAELLLPSRHGQHILQQLFWFLTRRN
jgi:hypothetical protein